MITASLQVGILATYCLVSLVLPVDPMASGQPRLAAAPFPLSSLLQTNLQQRWVMFRSSVRSNCLCLMHLLFPQPSLLEFVLFTDTVLCAHKKCRCSVGLESLGINHLEGDPLVSMFPIYTVPLAAPLSNYLTMHQYYTTYFVLRSNVIPCTDLFFV